MARSLLGFFQVVIAGFALVVSGYSLFGVFAALQQYYMGKSPYASSDAEISALRANASEERAGNSSPVASYRYSGPVPDQDHPSWDGPAGYEP